MARSTRFRCLTLALLGALQTTPAPAAETPKTVDQAQSWRSDPNSRGGYIRKSTTNTRVIVFLNGVFGNAESSWQSSNGAYWPDLIKSDPAFDTVDIYVHSFQSPAIAQAQQIDELASRLTDFLRVDSVLSYRQIVFVVHSMGGLIARAFLLKERLPPQQVPMIYFFGTPTAGANVAAIVSHLSANPQLKDMLPLSEGGYVKTLRESWLSTSKDALINYPNTIASFCAYELLDTGPVRVVTELSATYLCNRDTRGILKNHIGIVKPESKGDDAYVAFKAAYERTFGRTALAIARAIANPNPGYAWMHEFSIDTVYKEKLSLVRSSTQPVAVECGEEKSGEVRVGIDRPPGETVVYIRPTIEYTNLKSASAAILQLDKGGARVWYSLRGNDLDSGNCAVRGRANIGATSILAEQIGFR